MLERLMKIHLAFIFLLASLALHGQTPEIEWQRYFGGSQMDYLVDAIYHPDYGFIIVGSTSSCNGIIQNHHGGEDVLIMRVDLNGNILWFKTFGGSGDDKPIQLLANPSDATFYVLFETNSNDGDLTKIKSSNREDFGVLCLDYNGNEIFNSKKSFRDSPYYLQPKQMVINKNTGHLWVLTKSYNKPGGYDFEDKGYVINKIDKYGSATSIFRLYTEIEGNLTINEISSSPNGDIILAGSSVSKELNFEWDALKKKIKLPGFHRNYNQEAFVLVFDRYINFIASKAIGGLERDAAQKVIVSENSSSKYRMFLSSTSTDGDLNSNLGSTDIWQFNLNDKLETVSKLQMASTQTDVFLSSLPLFSHSDTRVTLINSVDIHSYQREKGTAFNEWGLPSENKAVDSIGLVTDKNTPGVKLILSDNSSIVRQLNFNVSDNQALVSDMGNNQFVVALNHKHKEYENTTLAGVDMKDGKILWQKMLVAPGKERIDKVFIINGDTYAIGSLSIWDKSVKPPLGFQGAVDITLIKLNGQGKKNALKNTFKDNLSENANSVKGSERNLQLQALVTYHSDTSNLNALWTFAQTSEYLAEYDVAATAYGSIISKLDKVKDKSSLSKARAHQITCNFLLQSQKKEPQNSIEANAETGNGFYGIGIYYFNIGNHLMVSAVNPGKGADKAGMKACDEIVSIDGVAVSSDCITSTTVREKLAGEKNSDVLLKVKRFGVKNLLELKVQRTFIPNQQTTASKNITPEQDQPESKQQKSQNFLKKMVTAMQQDEGLMKNIETAKKVTYALAIINKWASSPVDNKYFEQIDEQLGMFTSLISIIQGNKPSFTFDNNGKVSFGNPELKELGKTDYAKEAQTKYDAIAHTQEVKETKIDENVTFVEKNKQNDFSGEYACDRIVESPNPTECQEINKKHEYKRESSLNRTTGWTLSKPLIIQINGDKITTTIGMEHYAYSIIETMDARGKINVESYIERICQADGTINGNHATLKGNCRSKALVPMSSLTEKTDAYWDLELDFAEGYVTVKGTTTFFSINKPSSSIVIYKKIN